VPDVAIQTNQMSPFRLGLRTVGAEARIDLYYEYRARSVFGMGASQMSPERFRAGTCVPSRSTGSPSAVLTRAPSRRYSRAVAARTTGGHGVPGTNDAVGNDSKRVAKLERVNDVSSDWALLCAALLASACAAEEGAGERGNIPPAVYSQRVATNDVTIY